MMISKQSLLQKSALCATLALALAFAPVNFHASSLLSKQDVQAAGNGGGGNGGGGNGGGGNGGNGNDDSSPAGVESADGETGDEGPSLNGQGAARSGNPTAEAATNSETTGTEKAREVHEANKGVSNANGLNDGEEEGETGTESAGEGGDGEGGDDEGDDEISLGQALSNMAEDFGNLF